jgi:GNAT superfamily N-acetyltransferase
MIRRARPSDVDTLVALRSLMFREMGTAEEDLASSTWTRAAGAWFSRAVSSRDVVVVVGTVDGAPVSCAVGEATALIPGPGAPTGAVGLISNVATFPEHRGRGLATACTDAVIRWFLEDSAVERIDLFATDGGRRIYERRGFVASPFPAMRRRIERDVGGDAQIPGT